VGAGATILGPIAVGTNARIGAGSVVIKPVPSDATIVGVPGRIAGPKRPVELGADLEHAQLPDPVLRTLGETLSQQSRLEERIRALERAFSGVSLPLSAPESDQLPVGESDVRDALREVFDPEIGINVVDLGLVQEIVMGEDGDGVKVHMMTCQECSMVGHLVEQVRRKTRGVVGDAPVEVVLLDETWDWNYAAPYFAEGGGI
jgi:serine O-acetyltransferase